MPVQECHETFVMPDGHTVTCSKHRPGWHSATGAAVWPEQLEPGDEFCMAVSVAPTPSGDMLVHCGRMPHGPETQHYGSIGGMPRVW